MIRRPRRSPPFPPRRSSDLQLQGHRRSHALLAAAAGIVVATEIGERHDDGHDHQQGEEHEEHLAAAPDRKSTRLNSSHANISYAVFCLKKKTETDPVTDLRQ